MAKVATNEKLIGYDTNGKKLITAHFICDSQSDLPVQTEYDDYILYLGCTAHCISEHTDHELKSGGVWVQTLQIPADYDLLLNRPQINGHILTGNQTGNDLGLQNALTFDSTPTQSSTNPVTSGGIWTDQQKQEAEIGVVANAGAKNILNFTNYIVSGDTSISVANSGGIISVSGTPSQNTFVTVLPVKFSDEIPMILSGCPLNSNAMLLLRLLNDTVIAMDEGEGAEFTPSRNAYYKVVIRLVASTAYDLTFKPMIRPAAITDPTFQPYARTNPEITVLTDEDRAALVELVDGGAKNISKITIETIKSMNTGGTWTGNTYEINGATFTVNADMSINLSSNGQNITANTFLNLSDGIGVTTGTQYIVSGCPSGGSASTAHALIVYAADGSTRVAIDTGAGKEFSPEGSNLKFSIRLQGGKTYAPMVFYPMICTAAAWKISQAYQSYRPSWQEMYDMILALQ